MAARGGPHPEIQHWQVGAVRPPHDGGQVLQVGGQEGPVGGGAPHGAGLLVALEVCPPDATHVPPEGRVQRHQTQLQPKRIQTCRVRRSDMNLPGGTELGAMAGQPRPCDPPR